MNKSRKKELEEEAIRDNLTPTKDLQVDESNLNEEEKGHFEFPWMYLIVGGVILLVMVALIITIYALGGPVDGSSESLSSLTALIIKGR